MTENKRRIKQVGEHVDISFDRWSEIYHFISGL